MIPQSLFVFDSYKKAMAALLLGDGRRGQLSRAAEHLGCQPSFISRVIGTEVHLTPDQAFLLTRFWNLDGDEQSYFQTLVDWERASDQEYKKTLAAKIARLKRAQESLQTRTQKADFPIAAQEAIYFSSWHWSALHFLTSIPEFQSVSALSSRLGLSEALVLHYLKQLAAFGLVSEKRGRWHYESGQFHIPRESPFVGLHHQNWRSRAVLDAQNILNESVHYTTVLTLSKTDVERLKQLLLDFISESERIARPSEPEESVVLTCDLFRT